MFGRNFAEKCIIMHFLGVEKEGKALNAEFAETQRKKHTQKPRKKQIPRSSG
jgi:hypothetical protein